MTTNTDETTTIQTIQTLGQPNVPGDEDIDSNEIPQPGDGAGNFITANDFNFSAYGTRIHMWNICDTSRVRVSKVLVNKLDPYTSCTNSNWHGPTGRWWNGAACDYYGKYGLYAHNQWESKTFRNPGIFRLLVGGDGALKDLEEAQYLAYANYGTSVSSISTLENGSPYDQVNAQGYQMAADIAYTLSDITYATIVDENKLVLSSNPNSNTADIAVSGVTHAFGRGLPGYFMSPGKLNGMWTMAKMIDDPAPLMKFQDGQLHPEFACPPLGLKWEGFQDNLLDESAASLFANARHAANKKIQLVSIYRPEILYNTGGAGRDSQGQTTSFGVGVRSLNTFELTQLI